ncbi:uncharacterized protein LOC128167224 [Crassostrea angulata]|uniref:Fucolectin tachylectin-4 pentraxin-1 domain-containing protein n=1 Tax=Magallana gigas TaxID=29159 RepID=K1PD49_MAGGI|nr:uncharacterized protein LOC128167224 [Crassostrea angulata]|eukprot:XP_011428769.1 PREDICTED: uncharacterized protein LOC105329275 [Crassostrea gigas]
MNEVNPQNQDARISPEGTSLPGDERHLLASSNIKMIRKYVPVLTKSKASCASRRLRFVYLICGCLLFAISLVLMVAGTIRVNQCNRDEEVAWSERFIEENVDQFIATNNFALEKPTKQSSDRVTTAADGYSRLAVDGNSETCSQTDEEISPSWWVDLQAIRPIEAVIIKGPNAGLQNISISIQKTEPSFADVNSKSGALCYRQSEISKSIITSCGQNTDGRYVVIRKETNENNAQALVLCEVLVTQRV